MSQKKLATKLVNAGAKRSQYGELSESIFLTQGFKYDSAEHAEARFIEIGEDEYVYGRYSNPTVRMFEERMMALEGAEDAFAAATGMAAVSGVLLSTLRAGDHIVAAQALFGSCLYVVSEVLPRFGIEVTLVDGTDTTAWAEAVQDNTKVFFFESIANPTLDVIDIVAVSKIAKASEILVVIDNVFATPVFQNSFELGADVVIYSTTKHVDGQGRCLGGIVLGSKSFIREVYEPMNKHLGSAISPFNAWVHLKGLETLSLRCNAQADNAIAVADFLEGSDKVSRVLYPHHPTHPQYELSKSQMKRGGTVVSFEIKGGKEAAFRFLNRLNVIHLSNNLGDAKSLITHPTTTTHKSLSDAQRVQAGIGDGLLRLSLGIEDIDDLLADIQAGLDIV